MSRTLHRDRVVLPSKEKGAIKLEAFLKEARTGHRARPPETGINSAGNGVIVVDRGGGRIGLTGGRGAYYPRGAGDDFAGALSVGSKASGALTLRSSGLPGGSGGLPISAPASSTKSPRRQNPAGAERADE